MIYKDVRISIDDNIEYKDYKTNFTSNDNRIIVELKTSYKKILMIYTQSFLFKEYDFLNIVYSRKIIQQKVLTQLYLILIDRGALTRTRTANY